MPIKQPIQMHLTPRLTVEELCKIQTALGDDLNPIFWEETLACLENGESITVALISDPERLREQGFKIDAG